MVFERGMAERLRGALAQREVTVLMGARQAGKSTLAHQVFTGDRATLDEPAALTLAQRDPTTFLGAYGRPLLIDEVQRAPGLLLPIKAEVDAARLGGQDARGRFLLTGSADPSQLPGAHDSLAGRATTLRLRTLSQAELQGRPACDLPALLQGAPPGDWPLRGTQPGVGDLLGRARRGGYPLAQRGDQAEADGWLDDHLTSVVDLDFRDQARVRRSRDVLGFLRLLAARSGGLVNAADVGRNAGIERSQAARYQQVFEAIGIIDVLPALTGSMRSTEMASPKLHVSDTGVLWRLMRHSLSDVMVDEHHRGTVIEALVHAEVAAQVGSSRVRGCTLMHWRTKAGAEVDLVLTLPDGGVVGIEVKATANPGPHDFRGLRALRDAMPGRFRLGLLLTTHPRVIRQPGEGAPLWQAPIGILWGGG